MQNIKKTTLVIIIIIVSLSLIIALYGGILFNEDHIESSKIDELRKLAENGDM